MNKASGLFIPAGCIQHFKPTLPVSAKSFTDEQDRKRGLNPAEKTLNDLNKQIQKLMVEDKRIKWQSADDKCNQRTGISHLWQLVKDISGKKPHNSPNMGVRFANKIYLGPKMIANKFAHQFRLPPICLTGDKSIRQAKRQLHQLPLTGTPSFMPADTKSDPIGQIVHSHQTRRDEHPPPQEAQSWCHQLSYKHHKSHNLNRTDI